MSLPANLLEQAQAAVAPRNQGGKWAPVLPAVEILLARQFTLTEAVDWLVNQGAVSPAERVSAYSSIVQRFHRATVVKTRRGRPPGARDKTTRNRKKEEVP